MPNTTHTGIPRAYVLRIASRGAVLLAASGLLLAGCTTAAETHAPPAAAARPASAADDQGVARAARAREAEAVQQAMTARLNSNEERFGSGTNSPCSTSRSSMFTSACADVATAVGQDAKAALAAISGKSGLATLRSVATRLQQAADRYDSLGCAHAPSDTSVRHQCLDPAAQIAQGYPDLRDGVNMGLAGQ